MIVKLKKNSQKAKGFEPLKLRPGYATDATERVNLMEKDKPAAVAKTSKKVEKTNMRG